MFKHTFYSPGDVPPLKNLYNRRTQQNNRDTNNGNTIKYAMQLFVTIPTKVEGKGNLKGIKNRRGMIIQRIQIDFTYWVKWKSQ